MSTVNVLVFFSHQQNTSCRHQVKPDEPVVGDGAGQRMTTYIVHTYIVFLIFFIDNLEGKKEVLKSQSSRPSLLTMCD